MIYREMQCIIYHFIILFLVSQEYFIDDFSFKFIIPLIINDILILYTVVPLPPQRDSNVAIQQAKEETTTAVPPSSSSVSANTVANPTVTSNVITPTSNATSNASNVSNAPDTSNNNTSEAHITDRSTKT